ncbi:MAG: LLM class flavin-dependent oxidoreductase [Alphaproteobacteria bacterium]
MSARDLSDSTAADQDISAERLPVAGFGGQLIVGISVNNATGITDHGYELPDLLRAAYEAEQMGFDAVWVHDAPFGRRTLAAFDPVTVLAMIAGRTKRIQLCTGIIVPQFRNPVSLALQWASLFELAEGRAIMGVGSGAGTPRLQQRAYTAVAALRHGTTLDPERLYQRRGPLFAECLAVLRKLWAEDKVSFQGEFYRFDDVSLGHARPRSMPPIIVGAGNYFPKQPGAPVHHGWQEKNAGKFMPGPYKRVAELGDGWITPHVTPAEYEMFWRQIQDHADVVVPGKSIVKAFNCFVYVDDDPAAAREMVKKHLGDFHGPPIWDDVVERWAIAGPAALVAARLQQFIDVGVRIFQLVIGSPDQFGQMKLIAEKVLPLLRAASQHTVA